MSDYKLCYHPYTDVLPMRQRFNKQAINFSAAYYDMHMVSEYVKLNELSQLTKMGFEILENLGEKNYAFQLTNKFKIV